jgi:hypothetical protein
MEKGALLAAIQKQGSAADLFSQKQFCYRAETECTQEDLLFWSVCCPRCGVRRKRQPAILGKTPPLSETLLKLFEGTPNGKHTNSLRMDGRRRTD